MRRAAIIVLGLASIGAQAPTPVGLYGFTGSEIERIESGAVLSKPLKESSDKQLAGVVAVFIRKPVVEVAGILLEGKNLSADKTIRDLRVWKPDESAGTDGDLKTRYEAYRKDGLNGAGTRGQELALAIRETLPAARWAELSQPLLRYPAELPAGVEQRFFSYRQDLDGQPTDILSHRLGRIREHAALITEQRYYVSHTYDCRLIASDLVEVRGGTLLFYANSTFTDRVSGVGSSLKHSIGRSRMLADVAASLKELRERIET